MHQVGPLDRHTALGAEAAGVVVSGVSESDVQLLREILADLGVRLSDPTPVSEGTRAVVVLPAPPAAVLGAEDAREWIARGTRDVARQATGPVLLTTIAALQYESSALERLVAFAEAHPTAEQMAIARRRLPVAPGQHTDVDALLTEVTELSTLVQQLSALQEETVGLASAIASTAGTLPWVLTNLATGPRLLVRRVRMALTGRASGWRSIRAPTDLAERPLGVNLAGYIGAESGMGEAARTSIRALQAVGVPLALNNVEGPVRASDRSFTDFTRDNPHAINLVHLNADNMAWFASDRGRDYFTNRYTIGFWFWELGTFRRDFHPAFAYVHEVWVASRFVQEAIASVSPVPVVCLPPSVTTPEAAPVGRAHFGLPEGRVLFLFTFDVSSQMERKNPLAVIRAFRRAALGTRATLVLKFTNATMDPEAVTALHTAARGLDVRFLDGYFSRDELSALIRTCDAYVSLHRSEGFGLTIAEAMLFNRPVIATAYSGNVDFMGPGTAYPVRYRLTTLQRDYGPYLRGSEWAAPDEAHAAELMRAVVDNPSGAAATGRAGGAYVREHLSLAAASRRMLDRLEGIRAGRRPSDPAAAGTHA